MFAIDSEEWFSGKEMMWKVKQNYLTSIWSIALSFLYILIKLLKLIRNITCTYTCMIFFPFSFIFITGKLYIILTISGFNTQQKYWVYMRTDSFINLLLDLFLTRIWLELSLVYVYKAMLLFFFICISIIRDG